MSFDSLPMSRHVIERKIEMLDIVYCTLYSIAWADFGILTVLNFN